MRINIIGSGNVATHLALNLSKYIEICSVYSRHINNAEKLASKIKSKGIDKLAELDDSVDLNIIAVKDNAILDVTKQLNVNIPALHTSGAVSIEVLKEFKNAGILYPLQTFSKNSKLDLSTIPFLIEGNSLEFENFITDFCKAYLSKIIHSTTSELRSQIHLSAVISNNFITQLLVESESILNANNLKLDLLNPLITETIRKSFELGPKLAQTGPAKRNDIEVIEKQLNSISNPDLKKVYKLMTELIQKNH